MKNITWLLLGAFLAMSVVACGTEEENESPTPTATPAATSAVN